jgi:hypothetical protein
MFSGSCRETPIPAHTIARSTIYTKLPPKTLLSNENANSDAEAAGPIVRWIEAIICAIPFVAPSDRLLGAADDTYINTAPYRSESNFNDCTWGKVLGNSPNPIVEKAVIVSCSIMSSAAVGFMPPLEWRNAEFWKGNKM